MRFTTHALLPIFPEESWVLELIRKRVEYIWKGKFDLNPDTRGHLERKSCGFKNIPIRVNSCTVSYTCLKREFSFHFSRRWKKQSSTILFWKARKPNWTLLSRFVLHQLLKKGIINEVAQKSSSALFSQIVQIAFPRISAHTLINALPRLSAHPLGHSIKQPPLSNKAPCPPAPTTFTFSNSRDARRTW